MSNKGPTPRLTLQLFPSTEKECPEFNYRELLLDLHPQKNKQGDKTKKNNGVSNGLKDPFSDNDDDVERIAKQFEQKYGGSSTYGKKKKRSKMDDYADIGAGYDENDSFIDNTDGYDEIMPPECDTAYGGFYINSGSLEFKSINVKNDTNLPPAEGDEDSSPSVQRKSHKRALSSSESEEDSSSSNSVASTTEKPTDTEAENVKANGITDSDKSGDDANKPKPPSNKLTEENIPKKRWKSSQDLPPIDDNIHVTKTVKELLAEARTCVAPNRRRDPSTDSGSSDSESKPPATVQSSDNQASSDSSREIPQTSLPQQSSLLPTPTQQNPPPPPLPPGLPSEATVLAKRLKALADAHFSSHTGKLSGTEVNEIILGMEKQCRRPGVTPSLRQALFGHAAALLRRGKPGLIQRARRLADEQIKAEQNSSPLDRLKLVIEKMRPSLLENYRKESQKIVEINKSISIQNSTLEDDKKIPERRLPKRRFPWNDQVRAMLLEIVETQGDDIFKNEDTMTRFLQTVVFPLFPAGFVRMPTLIQQSKLSMAKKSSEVAKRIQPKSIETKILNPQVLLNKTTVKTTQQNSSDEKVSQPHVTEKLSFEAKLPSGTICVGTKIDDNKSQQTEKGKQYNSQIFGENLSISISNVAQKKNNIEKPTISPPKSDRSPVPTNIGSLTITPVSNSVKDSHTKTSPITSPFSVNNANNELQISPNQMSPGTIKVKSVNALFDKETIAKIISSKNSDSNNKHLTQNRDPQRVKSVDLHKPSKGNHTDYNIKIDNHQSSRTSIISDPKISSSESPKTHSNSNDLFIKPKSIKNDHSSFSGRIHNNSEHHQDVHMRDSENYKSDSVRLNKKYPDSPSNNPYIKSPGGTPTSNSAYSSNNKSGSTENYSTEIARTLNLPNSARALNFAGHNLNRSKQRNASDSYDSGSDDCEIVSDDLTKPHTREEEGSVPESLQKQFEMQYRAIYSGSQLPDKRTPPKSSDFTIKNIVKETDHSVKHILHAAHQDIPVTSKSSESRLNSDEDNNHSDKMSYKIGTEERSHPVSVIKDNFVNKSDRNKELVPESETSNNDLSPMEVAIDQEMDFTRMMQGYKELEDFQMKSPDGLSQRLYDDADNNKFRIPLIPEKSSIPSKTSKDDNILNKKTLYLGHSKCNITTGFLQ